MRIGVVVIAMVALGSAPAFAVKSCEKTDFKACEKLCKKKDARSCMNLAFLLMGIEEGAPATDDKQARVVMEGACKLKLGEACVYAGTMADAGRGQAKSTEHAHAWWDKGCKLKHGGSCMKLAFASYESGDKPKAAKYHEAACKNGEPSSCGALGQMEVQGDGIPAAPERGVKRLVGLCDGKGMGRACVEAGIAYEKAEVGKAPDLARAKALYQKGCDAAKSDPRGCTSAKRL
jgi:TPR repeat protein